MLSYSIDVFVSNVILSGTEIIFAQNVLHYKKNCMADLRM